MERNPLVDVLCIFFGIGTWLCVNGLWVELPLLVQHLPERWALPSYLAVVIQLANLGPVLYTVLNSFFPRVVTEVRSIYVVMLVGFIAVILLANFWNVTGSVFGQQHSAALLGLVFFVAAVDCSSRVLYLPFMARLQTIYLPSFFIGEGLSGLIPSIFALIQGVGGNPECRNNTFGNGTVAIIPDPLYSIDMFFYLMATITFCSFVAFFLLNQDGIIAKSLAEPLNMVPLSATGRRSEERSSKREPFYESTRWSEQDDESKAAFLNRDDPSNQSARKSRPLTKIEKPIESTRSIGELSYLLILQTVICGLANGVFPSIQSYSCLPYGNTTFHWAVTLSNMANPGVCFLMFCLPNPNKYSVAVTAMLGLGVSSYVMQTAVLSPNPPMVGTLEGELLLVAAWILLVGLFTYTKVAISSMLRDLGQKGLFWSGAFTQFGSSIGAVAAFFIIKYGDVFHSYYPCG
ncbi:unnamed protein product [Orchesella dallaii]|uniref:Riboflavin transporter n=1 Tax=Orchesella dallaii TaxID=48710 RepID=A0ABP1PLD0_9HEXA